MADVDFGFVPSGEGGQGFGETSFSTELESSFDVSGDGFGFGAQGDAWFVPAGEGDTDREKKKKKKKESKKSKENDESHGSWLDSVEPEGKSTGFEPRDDFPPSTGRRVSFSEEPPESRTPTSFGEDVAEKAPTSFATATTASSGWEHFARGEKSQGQLEAQRSPEHCFQCGKAFELNDSMYCRHCGFKRPPSLRTRTARSLLGLDPGVDGGRFGERFDEPRPLERRFSFSLSDMPDSQIRVGGPASHYGVEAGRENLDMQKWNPLDGIRRHWSPTDVEFQQLVGSSATAALAAHGHPASLQMLGSLNEAQKAEIRAKEMRKKIAHLETSLGGHSSAGHVAITAPLCHDGLGIVLDDLTVSHVTDPLAKQAGWAVGDSILKVNGTTILHSNQLSSELAQAMSASRAVGRPMLIDVWRHPANTPSPGTSLLHPSTAPSRSSHLHRGMEVSSVHYGRHQAAPVPMEPITGQGPTWTGPKLVSPAPQSWTGPQAAPDAPPASCVIA